MFCKYFLLFSLLVSSISAVANNTVLLAGKIIDTELIKPGCFVKFFIYDDYIGDYTKQSEDIFKALIKNDSFSLCIPAPSKLFYCKLQIEYADGSSILFYKFARPISLFLLEAGDSIWMDVSRENLSFRGTGAEKLQCQSKIYSLKYLPSGGLNWINELDSKQQFYSAYVETYKLLDFQIKFRTSVLRGYENKFSKSAYDRIYFDCIYQLYIQLFWNLHSAKNYIGFKSRIRDGRKFIGEFIENNYFLERNSYENDTNRLKSAYYANCLFQKERVLLEYSDSGDSLKKMSFDDIYNEIKRKYTGQLRDRLILIAFNELAKSKSDVFNSLDDAVETIQNKKYKEVLLRWKETLVAGGPAFNFELPDTTGRMFKLNDFKGKILVIDFWFTGCFGCTKMPEALKNVNEKYKDNSRVVFININVDRTRNWWMSGLKSGVYTLPGHLSLSLYGLGIDHPMIKYYNYASYPQLLVIDSDGKNVSVYPPDPRLDNGLALGSLIDELLDDKLIH